MVFQDGYVGINTTRATGGMVPVAPDVRDPVTQANVHQMDFSYPPSVVCLCNRHNGLSRPIMKLDELSPDT